MTNRTSIITYDEDTIQSNVVTNDKLKKIQKAVLHHLKNSIVHSMGPAGSNTLILKGNTADSMVSEYTKDGKKIINSIRYADPIETSIQREITDICRHIEVTVGDGTSSAVALSSIIYDALTEILGTAVNPFQMIRDFQEAVEEVKKEIKTHGNLCTSDDIYKIAMISTNGNEKIAHMLLSVYDKFGMDVYIDVSASINGNTYTKEYDGLTLEVGYSDPAYINTPEGSSCINSPRIYAFQDPIDTPQMVSYFEKIAQTNFMAYASDPANAVPTVILAPSISRDMLSIIKLIVEYMSAYRPEMITQKPPFLLITNIHGTNQNIYENIMKLCGTKMIRKYIDDSIEKRDQEAGLAPTIDTVAEWYGTCEKIVSDGIGTIFYTPDKMFEKNEDGTNNPDVYGTEYINLLNYLETELRKAEEDATELGMIGSLKRQVNALKANMVEFFVGGVTDTDRDSLRDLVEDAVLNCRSAARHGVGYGANFEGYRAARKIVESSETINPYTAIIMDSFKKIISLLYSTVRTDGDPTIEQLVEDSYFVGCPWNLSKRDFDHKVKSSIASDIVVLDTVVKIISIMFTANQALVQAPQLNKYV